MRQRVLVLCVVVSACATPPKPAAEVHVPVTVIDTVQPSSPAAGWLTEATTADSSDSRPGPAAGVTGAAVATLRMDVEPVGEPLAPLDAHHVHDRAAAGDALDIVGWLTALGRPDPQDREGVARFVATHWANVGGVVEQTPPIDDFVSPALRATWPSAVASAIDLSVTGWYPIRSEAADRGDVVVVFARVSTAALGPMVFHAVGVAMSDASGVWRATWVGTR